jgi:hypothetical protein
MPSLKDISLYVGSCGTQLFTHLALRPALKSLQICLGNPESDPEILLFLEQIDTPIFSNLQSLKISGTGDSKLCKALFSHVTNLHFLDIQCNLHLSRDDFSLSPELNAYDRFFAQLPTSPELDHLGVEFSIQCDQRPDCWYLKLPGFSLVRLAEKYSNLRTLKLSTLGEGIDGTAITHADIDRLASLLPNLVSLKMGLSQIQHLTIKCLESLAKHCHSLKECEIVGDFDITSLEMDRACLFPTLRYIVVRLKDQQSWSDLEIQQLKAVLEHHFPRLTSIAGLRVFQTWHPPMVSSHPPWTEPKLRCFVEGREDGLSPGDNHFGWPEWETTSLEELESEESGPDNIE